MAPSCHRQRRHPTSFPRHPVLRQQVKSKFTENFFFLQFPFSSPPTPSQPPAFYSATHVRVHVTKRISNVRQIIFPSVGFFFFSPHFIFFNGSGICEVLPVTDTARSRAVHYQQPAVGVSFLAAPAVVMERACISSADSCRLAEKMKVVFSCSAVVLSFPAHPDGVF